LRSTQDHYQDKPVANPFARMNLEFFLPMDIRLDLLGQWRAGQTLTWTGPGATISGLDNNLRRKNFTMLDIRLSKNFDTGLGRAQVFADIDNVLNLKYLFNNGPFESPTEDDYNQYMTSLHLPSETFEAYKASYINMPGTDLPGDYRKEEVAFVPIETVAEVTDDKPLPTKDDLGYLEADRRLLYYVEKTEKYFEMNDSGVWEEAGSAFVDQVLEDKAYIDMPNETYRTFLNPRSINFGVRVWF
ncbi:MAG: hypothetical protein CEE38_23730, partial [Planctomycetes bacterium B3_Pla]